MLSPKVKENTVLLLKEGNIPEMASRSSGILKGEVVMW